MHISFEFIVKIFMKLSSTLISDFTIYDVPIAVRLERRTVGTTTTINFWCMGMGIINFKEYKVPSQISDGKLPGYQKVVKFIF